MAIHKLDAVSVLGIPVPSRKSRASHRTWASGAVTKGLCVLGSCLVSSHLDVQLRHLSVSLYCKTVF